MPGLVGLNNMKNNDYVNVAMQILARVAPIRDFFLIPANYAACRSVLVQRFGELVRKIWHPRNFKGQVIWIDGFWLSHAECIEPADIVMLMLSDATARSFGGMPYRWHLLLSCKALAQQVLIFCRLMTLPSSTPLVGVYCRTCHAARCLRLLLVLYCNASPIGLHVLFRRIQCTTCWQGHPHAGLQLEIFVLHKHSMWSELLVSSFLHLKQPQQARQRSSRF